MVDRAQKSKCRVRLFNLKCHARVVFGGLLLANLDTKLSSVIRIKKLTVLFTVRVMIHSSLKQTTD